MTDTIPRLPRSAPRSRLSARAWTFVCLAVVVVLRAPFLRVPLGIDEGGDSFVARRWTTSEGSMYGDSWLDRPPLLVLLYRVGVMGGDLGVRLLGMAAAIALVLGAMAIAKELGGTRASVITGLLTAIMSSSVVLGAVFTSNELLAAVPVVWSVLALVRSRDAAHPVRWLFLSGFLATCALLIKQSFFEVLVAGVVYLGVSWYTRSESAFRASWIAAWCAGALVPLLATLVWFEIYSVGVRQFAYAIVGFRVDAFSLLNQTQQGASYMLMHLGLPIAIVSGCLFLVPWAVSWLYGHRADPQLVLPLAAWLVVGFVGITGGGNYYPHYFIQPLAALAVLTGCALAVTRKRVLSMLTAAIFGILAVGNVAVGTTLKEAAPPQARTLVVADYLRDHAAEDDSLYVVYARANLLYYAKMHAPYPYAWSMMVRTVPAAEARLRQMLRSPERPTWIVEWQDTSAFGLDASGETRRLIDEHYEKAATICHIPVFIRRDLADRRSLAPAPAHECPTLDVPDKLGPQLDRTPIDSAEYLWQ